MRLSRFFLPILKENPKEAEIVSHRLMLRAGMMRQEAAGIYAWLPLGFRVLKKIEQIVREEQDRAGALELLMPTLQLADLWRESGRYDAYGPEMLRINDRHKRELLYGPTNEEMITEIFRAYVKSYRSLPLNLYHIQWKFRDEQPIEFAEGHVITKQLAAQLFEHGCNRWLPIFWCRHHATHGIGRVTSTRDINRHDKTSRSLEMLHPAAS